MCKPIQEQNLGSIYNTLKKNLFSGILDASAVMVNTDLVTCKREIVNAPFIIKHSDS